MMSSHVDEYVGFITYSSYFYGSSGYLGCQSGYFGDHYQGYKISKSDKICVGLHIGNV